MSSSNFKRLSKVNDRNKRRLLDSVGVSSIHQYRQLNPEFRSNEEAYNSILGLYNTNFDIIQQQQEDQRRARLQQLRTQRNIEKEQMKLDKQQYKSINTYVKGINSQLNNFEKENITGFVDIDLENINGNIRQFIQGLKLGKKRLFLQSGNKRYMLNMITLRRLEELLTPYIIHTTEFISGQEIITEIQETGNFSIGIFAPKGQEMIEGGLFPFTHNLTIDLDDYGIYQKYSNWGDLNNEENCFIKALQIKNIDITKAKEYITNQYLCQRKLEQLAPILNLFIRVKRLYINGNIASKVNEYGNPNDPIIELGLLDKHYFIIQPTIYTSYAIKNYFQIKHLSNWEKITKISDGYYKRDCDREIDSYNLIKILLENKETHLNELEGVEIYKLINWKDNEETIYKNLNYNDTLYDRRDNPNGELLHLSSKQNFKEYVNISYFDFETTTTRNDGVPTIHKPYLCCITNDYAKLISNPKRINCYEGEKCAKLMLDDLWREFGDYREAVEARKKIGFMEGNFDIDYPCVLLIAHNAGYDFRFILEHLVDLETIEKGNGLMMANAYYTKTDRNTKRVKTIKFEIRCSLKMINMPLANFGKSFGMEIKKEIMPYSFYTEENVKQRNFPIEEFLSAIPVKDHQDVLNNIERWKSYKNNINNGIMKPDKKIIDIIKYSREYCMMDCFVLKQGYEIFRKLCYEAIQLDPINYISLASMADDYLKKEDCYKQVYQLCGVPRAFIQRCIVGGRTMIAKNEKIHIQDKIINDFDAVSLYPTGMERMNGFLIGKPKVITEFTPNEYTSYFICIRITKIGRHLRFPLISIKNDKGIRNFTNDLVGRIIYIDKTGLEDAIKYQQIEYEFINGYYYDSGYNPQIKITIRHLFTQRLKYKKVDNPLQLVFKECMNSCYGKSYMKPIDKDITYVPVDEIDKFMTRQYNYIKEATLLDN